jgi:hypothetical protein
VEETSLPRWFDKQADLASIHGESFATMCLITSMIIEVDTSIVALTFNSDGEEIPPKPWLVEQREIVSRLQTIEGIKELLYRRVENSEGYDELEDDWLVGSEEDCKYETKEEMFAAVNFNYIANITKKALDLLKE